MDLYERALRECYDGWHAAVRWRPGAHNLDAHVFHQPFAKMAKKACASVHGEAAFNTLTEPSTRLGRALGNAYAGSAWLGLVSHLVHAGVAGQRIGVFSYGSGAMATMLSMRVSDNATGWLRALRGTGPGALLDSRTQVTPEQLEQALARREQRAAPGRASLKVRAGEYFLADVCPRTRHRTYERAS